jgi:hypothetical protein
MRRRRAAVVAVTLLAVFALPAAAARQELR